MSATVEIQQLRTRWRRWLGNKTRLGYPYWTTLLDVNWLDWVSGVFAACDFPPHGLTWESHPLQIKSAYAKAIDNATASQLRKLDAIYAEQKQR